MVNKSKKSKRNQRNNKKNKVKKNKLELTSKILEEDKNVEELDTVEHAEHEKSDIEESRKRDHSEDESDSEDKPTKKKKKNKPVAESTGDKKGKKSIRQMKREKHALRLAEVQAASKDQLKTLCLNYLSQWKHDKQNWKFMKAKQVWLFKNKFSAKLVPDASWPLLLEYFESAKGNIRNLLLEDANKIIKLQDEWIEALNHKQDKKAEEDEDEIESPEGLKKPDESSYKRARDLIQCLQE